MQHRDVTVAAVMTAPRYESVWARGRIERALGELGIPLTISGGVFYGQCMQRMFEGLVDNEPLAKKPAEYVLTVDFDSIFTAEHVRRLLSIIVQEDHIDAITSAQPMRGQGRLLGTTGKAESVEWTGEPIKMTAGHFGLTILDLRKLARVEKPWFLAKPDENGGWGDNKVDDDVSFWRAWEKAGNSLYLDPGTRLGHLEEMITVFDPQMKVQHLYPKQWETERAATVDQGLAAVPQRDDIHSDDEAGDANTCATGNRERS